VRARFNFDGAQNVRIIQLETVDSWIRDYGPNFLIDERGALAYNDWIFNAWGSKYEELKRDDAIPKALERILNVPRFEPGIVLEGGAIDVNGAGCVLTTEQCLLNPNRNPHLTRAEIETYLRDYLNISKIIWLGEGISGDDTDGHIDDIARFVNESTIVCAVEEDTADPNHELLQDNLRRLQHATDANNRPFEIITLPMPGIIEGRDGRLPASYANFLIANSVVLTPVFNHANDARAVSTLQSLFPTRRVTPIRADDLVWGMGTIHCLSQQQPAA
jgi:agmatine deiminase